MDSCMQQAATVQHPDARPLARALGSHLCIVTVVAWEHQRRRQGGRLSRLPAQPQQQLPQAHHVALAVQPLQQGRGTRWGP